MGPANTSPISNRMLGHLPSSTLIAYASLGRQQLTIDQPSIADG
jgi:hypothetical protein